LFYLTVKLRKSSTLLRETMVNHLNVSRKQQWNENSLFSFKKLFQLAWSQKEKLRGKILWKSGNIVVPDR
jgi:hypothetical protein